MSSSYKGRVWFPKLLTTALLLILLVYEPGIAAAFYCPQVRDQGSTVTYVFAFSRYDIDKMAKDWFLADHYARQMVWRMVGEQFGWTKAQVFNPEVAGSVSIAIKTTADKLYYLSQQYQGRLKQGQQLYYQLEVNKAGVASVKILEALKEAVEMARGSLRPRW